MATRRNLGTFFFAYFAQTETHAVCQRRFLPFGQILVALGNNACLRHCIDGTG